MRVGSIADAQVDVPAAERYYREALEIRLRLGDRAGTFGPLNNLGNLALQSGDYAAARRAHEESLTLARELDEADPIASSLHNLALVYLVEDDAAGALPLLEESLVLAEALQTPYGLANVHANLGAALVDLGELGRGAAHLAESIRRLRELDATESLPPTIEDQAALARRDRRPGDRGPAAGRRDGGARQRRLGNRAERRRSRRPHGGEGAYGARRRGVLAGVRGGPRADARRRRGFRRAGGCGSGRAPG